MSLRRRQQVPPCAKSRWRRGCCTSSPLCAHDAAKDMSESRVVTRSSPKSRTTSRERTAVVDHEAGIEPRFRPSTSIVLLWRRDAPPVSTRCTRCRRLSREAAARPECPPRPPQCSSCAPGLPGLAGQCLCCVHDKWLTAAQPRDTLASRTRDIDGTRTHACGRWRFGLHDDRRRLVGLLMKNFYREQLAPIVRLGDGGIARNWPAASSGMRCSAPASPSS